MSVSSGLSGRYAKAIYELAEEKKILTKIVDDFMRLKKLLEESDSLSNLIKSPLYLNLINKIQYLKF